MKIEQTIIDSNLNPRCEGLDLVIVAEYAEAMQRGDVFPPIDVFSDGKSYWVVDGFHRIEAAKQAGISEIEVNVHSGNWRDAKLFSLGVNAEHGKTRTNADKRKAVMEMLQDEEWGRWSDREIARRCRVSHPFVIELRKVLTGNITSENTERTYVTKHGTISVISDLFGNQETLFLERQYFHRWLNSIQPARVKNEAVRERLIKYQLECTDAIDDYFSNRLKDYITVNWYTSYQTVNT